MKFSTKISYSGWIRNLVFLAVIVLFAFDIFGECASYQCYNVRGFSDINSVFLLPFFISLPGSDS